MKFEYKKLNTFTVSTKTELGYFPLVMAGVFNDGQNKHPIYLFEQGELLATIEAPDILSADEQVKTLLNIKKIPAEMVVSLI